MLSYKFSYEGYDYNISYDDRKSTDKFDEDEKTNFLYYSYIKQVRKEFTLARWVALLFFLVFCGSASVLPILIATQQGYLYYIGVILIVFDVLFSGVTLFFALASSDTVEDYITNIEIAYTRTSTGLKQKEQQEREIKKKIKEQSREKAVKVNNIYKTLIDKNLTEEDKINKISKYFNSL